MYFRDRLLKNDKDFQEDLDRFQPHHVNEVIRVVSGRVTQPDRESIRAS